MNREGYGGHTKITWEVSKILRGHIKKNEFFIFKHSLYKNGETSISVIESTCGGRSRLMHRERTKKEFRKCQDTKHCTGSLGPYPHDGRSYDGPASVHRCLQESSLIAAVYKSYTMSSTGSSALEQSRLGPLL